MDARVISAFTDKHSGRVFLSGDMFSGEEARVAELASAGFVEGMGAPEKPKRATRKAPAKKKAAEG